MAEGDSLVRIARKLEPAMFDRKKIRLDVPIHQVGTYMIDVEVAGGAIASVKTIVAEEK